MSEVYTWDAVAANNNDPPPDGWPENMAYNAVNNCAREMMAALKRDLDDRNGSLSTTGVAPAYALTSARTIPALTDGLLMAFRAHAASSGAAPVTLNLNGLGARAVEYAGPAPFSEFPIINIGDIVQVVWDATQTRWQILSVLLGAAFGGGFGATLSWGVAGVDTPFVAAHVSGATLVVAADNSIFTLPAGLPDGRIRILNPNQYSYTIKNSSGYTINRTDDATPIKDVGAGSPYTFTTQNVGACLVLNPGFFQVYVDVLL